MTEFLDLSGRVALVTGSGRGIGLEIARTLAGQGARVVLADLDPELAAGAAATIAGATTVDLDVTSDAQWRAAMSRIESDCGRLDILVNNAGVSPAGTVEQTDLDLWRKVYTTNVESVFLGCHHGLPLIRKGSRGGAIVNMSSTTALRPAAALAAYSSSKAAVCALTKSVALHAAKDRIRCNSVHPGGTHTRMLDDFAALTGDREAALARFNAANPLGRVGTPADIAAAVLFLVSDRAEWITGLEMVVDGGSTL